MSLDANEAKHALFGDTNEWEDFGRRNPEFLTRIGNLVDTIRVAFGPLHATEPIDKILFHLNRLCVEDFSEILLLCGNGCGIGAEKLLRGMYERAIHATYLHEHPEEAETFLDYHKVAAHKLMIAVEQTLGNPFSPEQRQQIEEEYKQVKDRFMITDCEACKTKRLNHSWSKLDFVSMAMQSGALAQLLVPAYYMGVREGHSTIGAIFSRLDFNAVEDEGLVFGGSSQPDRADMALLTAHKIVLMVLDLHQKHYQLAALEAPLQTCVEDFFVIWDKSSALGTSKTA